MGETMEQATREHERRLTMAPYLERLYETCGGGEAPGAEAPYAPMVRELDPWELDAVRHGVRPEQGKEHDWEALIAEGVALQAKYLEDLQELHEGEPAAPEELDLAHRPLLETGAVGIALMEELQRVIDAMILGGKMGEAKKLSSFRGRISRAVSEIRDRVGDEAFAKAEAAAGEMIAPMPEKVQSGPRLTEPDEGPPRQVRFDRYAGRPLGVAVPDEPRSHVKPLVGIFVAAIAAWLILVLPRSFVTEIPPLTIEQVSVSSVIEEVTARPPSLFVVVDGAGWSAMPMERREELVRQVGDTAKTNGYTGVQVRTKEGVSVAQWTRARGVHVLAAPRSDS